MGVNFGERKTEKKKNEANYHGVSSVVDGRKGERKRGDCTR